jgi:hypothetical protein
VRVYDPRKWPEELASRRRAERQGAVLQILSHAQMVQADFLVVAGDVCDFPEDMPAAVRGGLEQLQQHGCVPLLFFTNKGHDRNRDWWSGSAVGPLKGSPTGGHDTLPHAISLGGVLFSAHDEVPAPDQVIVRAHEGDLLRVASSCSLPW